LASVGVDRRVSASSTLYVQAQVGYSSGAESLRTGASLIAPSAAFTDASSPNPVKQSSASLGWNFVRPRTTLSLFSSYIVQRYQHEGSLDQNNLSIQAHLVYRLQPTLYTTLTLRRDAPRYRNLGADVAQTTIAAAITKSFARTGVSLRYERTHRGGSAAGNDVIGVYEESRVGLYVSYELLTRLNANASGGR